MTIPKLYYSAADMKRDLAAMYRQMHLDGYKPDVIVGITRGGLIPSVYVSHYYEETLTTINVSFRDSKVKDSTKALADLLVSGKKVLIVDDICDSGETLEWIHSELTKQAGENITTEFLKTMVLIHNDACKVHVPNYTGTHVNKAENNVWVQFDWEQ